MVSSKLNESNVFLDYNLIGSRLDTLASRVKRANYDSIVMIVRGGTFAGMHMVFLTELPYTFMVHDRVTGTSSFYGDVKAEGRRVLLCEDFAGRGRTLLSCKETLENMGYEVDTLVISTDTLSASEPDYKCFHMDEYHKRFVFPWERYRINNEVFKNGDGKSDIVFERRGWDNQLGVDYAYGEEMLDLVKMRDMLRGEDYMKSLREEIVSRGLTEVVLSSSDESVLLAYECPELRVYWSDGLSEIRVMA